MQIIGLTMIPKSVNVLGREYQIEVEQHLPNMFGYCDYENLLIKIKADQQPAMELDTVLHEILHAIDYSMNTELEERQIYCMTVGILSVLKYNQPLLEYLYKATKK
jgi:hypothetical protein